MPTKALEELHKAILRANPHGSCSNICHQLQGILPVLLNSWKAPNISEFREYEDLLSTKIVELYKQYPAPSLDFACSLITKLFKTRLTPQLKIKSDKGALKDINIWEQVFRWIFNGLLDYLDCGEADLIKIGSRLYKPLFGILCSIPGMKLGARLRAQIYGLLSDAAEDNKKNKELLRKPSVLGGARLGNLIIATDEYLVLDSLFLLLARLTPSTKDSFARVSMANDVFNNAKTIKALGTQLCTELARLYKNATGDEWETIVEGMFRTLAQADPSKPQPFRLLDPNIRASSVVISHPPLLDSIYLDKSGFLVNIQDNDAIDCLHVEYSSVVSISTDEAKYGEGTEVVLNLASPPRKTDEEIPATMGGNRVVFIISERDKTAFTNALKIRGLGSKIDVDEKPALKMRESVSTSGPLDLNVISEAPPEVKSKTVQNFYAISSPSNAHSRSVTEENGGGTLPESKVAVTSSKSPLSEAAAAELIFQKLTTPVTKPSIRRGRFKLSDWLVDVTSDSPLSEPEPPSPTPVGKKASAERNPVLPRNEERHVPVEEKPEAMTSPREPIPSKKRKRNDDEDAESTIAQDAVIEPSYNSQFLNPSETATTRSTTKYKSRARISSPSARPLDFDVIPVKKPQVSSIFNTSKSKAVPLHMKKLDVSSIQPDKPISKKRSAPRPKLKLKQAEAEKHDPSPIVAPRTRISNKRAKVVESDPEEEPEEELSIASNNGKRSKEMSEDVTKISSPTKKTPWNSLPAVIVESSRPELPKLPDPSHPVSKLDAILPISDPQQPETIKSEETPDEVQPDSNTTLSMTNRSFYASDNNAFDTSHDLAPFNITQEGDFPMYLNEPIETTNISTPAATTLAHLVDDSGFAEAEHLCPRLFPFTDLTECGDKTLVASSDPLLVRKSENPGQQIAQNKDIIDLTCLKDEPSTFASPPTVSNFVITDLLLSQEPPLDCTIPHSGPPNAVTDANIKPSSKTKARLSVTFAEDTKKSVSPAPARLKSILPKNNAPSRIPRLIPKQKREIAEISVSKKAAPLEVVERPREQKPFTSGHAFQHGLRYSNRVAEESDSESESEPSKPLPANVDAKIVAVLDRIHHVILENLSRKFNTATIQTNSVAENIKKFAAEDLNLMLNENNVHRRRLEGMEEEYANFGRITKEGFEEILKADQAVDKQLREAIVSHDRASLARQFPKKLAPRPKILQTLVAALN